MYKLCDFSPQVSIYQYVYDVHKFALSCKQNKAKLLYLAEF